MNCICENMIENGLDMHNMTYRTVDYKGFILHENYGQWRMEFDGDVRKSAEIFYCPFCGRKLNKWGWANERRKANFEKHIKMKF